MRLDILVSETYGFSRNKSQAFIRDGLITVDGIIVSKPSFEIGGTERLELEDAKKTRWVSRSAGKLDGFLEELNTQGKIIHVENAYCLDVGSSTGGFTQVLLERGASHIDAVDVGTDQLDMRIRIDPRVSSYEQTDIRDFPPPFEGGIQGGSDRGENPESLCDSSLQKGAYRYDIIVCDASFISLREILPSILALASHTTSIILLWKPQFEVGREHLRHTGVPKDEKIVREKQKEWEKFIEESNCEILHKEKSSVFGEAGNEEWLYRIVKI